LAARLALAWARLFRHPQWNIGILREPIESVLANGVFTDEHIEWFPLDGRKDFLSDPFPVVRDGVVTILCERFPYDVGRGVIASVVYADGRFRGAEAAISRAEHMSYPCVIEWGGDIYCVPETHAAREVALYRAVEFPSRWEKVAVLIANFAGVDPTVLFREGRWWLFCTERGATENTNLLLWHAADLLGPWEPHAANPVKVDIRSARPGGTLFVHDGALYRPAQDCSTRYGGALSIQRVLRLDSQGFAEETVSRITPPRDSRYPMGRHTLSRAGDVMIVDGHRFVFVWDAFTAFLRIWFRDIRRRPPLMLTA
jgi:hypothetical protein